MARQRVSKLTYSRVRGAFLPLVNLRIKASLIGFIVNDEGGDIFHIQFAQERG